MGQGVELLYCAVVRKKYTLECDTKGVLGLTYF